MDADTQRYELHVLVRAFAAGRVRDEPALALRHARFYAQLAADTQRMWARGGEHRAAGRAWYQREQANIDEAW